MRPDLEEERRLTLLLVRVLFYLIFLALFYLVLERLAMVIAPVLVALLLAFLLDPLVRGLEVRGVPRWLAVMLLILGFLIALTGVALALPSLMASELDGFVDRLPHYGELLREKVLPWLARVFKERRVANVNDWSRLITDRLGEFIRGASGQLSSAAGSALTGVAGILRVLIAVLLTPIFTVSFLMSMPSLTQRVRRLVPPRHQQLASDIVRDLSVALGGWLRGQLTVMLIQAVLYSIGLSLCGIPLAVIIGCATGFLAFVPYVGVSIGLLCAVLAALLELRLRGAGPLLGVLITFASVQVLDALIITPRAVGGRIGLSVVGVILALSIGGALIGYVGLLVAVPLAAVLKALGPRLLDAYMATGFYAGSALTKTSQPSDDHHDRAAEPGEPA